MPRSFVTTGDTAGRWQIPREESSDPIPLLFPSTLPPFSLENVVCCIGSLRGLGVKCRGADSLWTATE